MGGGVDHVLAIVEDQEQLAVAQVADNCFQQRLIGQLPKPEGGGDGPQHPLRLRHGRQLDQPDPVAIPISASTAICSDKRVFPEPPTPAIVNSLVPRKAAEASSSSWSRPTKLVS